jgi:hypothetical protein
VAPSLKEMIGASMSEAELQNNIVELANVFGWLVFHDHDSRMNNPGFPDLVLVRERVIYAELKNAKGKYRPDQKVWMRQLIGAGESCFLWRPAHWQDGSIEKELKRQQGRPMVYEVKASLKRCELDEP